MAGRWGEGGDITVGSHMGRGVRPHLGALVCQLRGAVMLPYLHIAPIKVHPSDHAALGCHVGPVNHLFSVVKVQGNGIVQTLDLGSGESGSQPAAGTHLFLGPVDICGSGGS